MNDWQIWFETGITHILDINGYDHMLFISLLVFAFPVTDWKKLLILITAFTVGHSITLLLSVVDLVRVPQQYTELLIILTIITAALHLLFNSKNPVKGGSVIYIIICCFGLIHGLGFSYLLKAMLNHHQGILVPLMMFNIGLEVGQVVLVVLMVLVLILVDKYAKPIERPLKMSCISVILVLSLFLCYSRIINIINA